MLFSIIYSADCPADENIDRFAPPDLSAWDETEDDRSFDYGHLEGRWENGQHRKWCALLTRDQFDEFIEHCRLQAEDVETMGSLGAPGFGYEWAPAISFCGDDPDVIQSAYVTPVPEVEREQIGENDWERVKSAVLAVYG